MSAAGAGSLRRAGVQAVKVHRDFHAEVAKALYSLPEHRIGSSLDVRADTELVKFYSTAARLVKVHPRQPPGGRTTDRADLPEHKAGYALRDLTALIATCAAHGPNIGIYAERILDDPLPWTRMRTVYRLQGLVRRYGAGAVEARMRTIAGPRCRLGPRSPPCWNAPPRTPPRHCPAWPAQPPPPARFARDPAEFTTARHQSISP